MASEPNYKGRTISVFSKKLGKEVKVDLNQPEYVSEDQKRNTAVAPSNWW